MKDKKNYLKFAQDFLKAMTNDGSGHSLRKWLAVGCFWVLAKVCISYTNKDNLVLVITCLSSLITALVITYTVGNVSEKKIDKKDGDNTTGV